MAQDSGEAEDLVQEVYLQAWKSFHRFELGTNCRAWLFKILFHRLHHFRRRWASAAKVEAFESPADQDSVVASGPVPQEIRDEDVLRALGKLPIEFREVVLLADVQEFSYKEIAETMKLPLGTVMSRLSRGRKLLGRNWRGLPTLTGSRPPSSGRVQVNPHERPKLRLEAVRADTPEPRPVSQQRAFGGDHQRRAATPGDLRSVHCRTRYSHPRARRPTPGCRATGSATRTATHGRATAQEDATRLVRGFSRPQTRRGGNCWWCFLESLSRTRVDRVCSAESEW